MGIEWIDIKKIKPAKYNPRKITSEQFELLKKSIADIGFCMPIIVNATDGTIIAGHQRTKAAQSLGINTVPCIKVECIAKGDEIKFNQMHNAAESDGQIKILHKFSPGIHVASQDDFLISQSKAPFVKEICKLLLKYGNALCAVSCSDSILVGHNYIKACQLLKMPINLSVIAEAKKSLADKYFKSEYGEYCYEKLSKNTYVQGLAQLYRNPHQNSNKKRQASTLYEKFVIPYLSNFKSSSVLDFGCGKGDYIAMIGKSHKAVGVEFFNNNGKQIDIGKGNKMIDELIKHIVHYGLFDVVVCDSVLNSVDCKEAEKAVMFCVNAFTKDTAFVSGRPLDSATNKYNLKSDKYVAKRFLEFFDSDNFSANYRNGNWYYQKWHTKEQFINLAHECGFEIVKLDWLKHGDSFQAQLSKERQPTDKEIEFALNYEFNLPLPGGRRYQRHVDVLNAYKKAVGVNGYD